MDDVKTKMSKNMKREYDDDKMRMKQKIENEVTCKLMRRLPCAEVGCMRCKLSCVRAEVGPRFFFT